MTVSERGFTLIEIVLAVALIAIVAGVGLRVPYLLAPDRAADADITNAVTALYRAQTLAAAGRGDSTWGVRADADTITVFRGPSFDERDDTSDTVFDLSTGVVADSPREIMFAKGTGIPDAPATVSLDFPDRRTSVTVSRFGVIDHITYDE